MHCRYISLCCVIVLYLPWSKSIYLTGSKAVVLDGEEFILRCRTSVARTIRWYRNGAAIKRSYKNNNYPCDFNTVAGYPYYQYKSCGREHQIKLTINYNRDNDVTWRCGYWYNTSPITSTYTINVSIYLTGSEAVVLDGEEFILICRTSVARTITWYRNDVFIKHSDVNRYGSCEFNTVPGYQFKSCRKEHQLKLTINYNTDNDVTWECGYWIGRRYVASSYTINVSIAPRLKIEYVNTNNQSILICTADGRPENVTFLPWKHTINTQLVREVTGYKISDNVYVLNISHDLQINQGTYICTASNGIINRTIDSVYQTISYDLSTEVEPEIDDRNVSNQSDIQVGGMFEFNVTFNSVSESDVSWYRDAMELHQTKRLSISQEGTNISHPYNQNITIPAITAVLTITSVATSDEGIYSSSVCNVVGCINTTFHLTVLKVPVPMTPQSQEDSTVNDQRILIIAGSVGSACIIIILVAVVIVVVKRKHRQPTKAVRDRDCTVDRSQNTDLEKLEPIILENDLYISADAWNEDASMTVDKPDPAAAGPLYGNVNKTNKQGSPTDETYAPVYGTVNKNKSTVTAGPIYGVVNKPPTTDAKTEKPGSYSNINKPGKSRDKSKVRNTLLYDNASNTDSSGQPVPVCGGRADDKHHRIKPLQDSNQNQICQSNVVYYNTSSEVVSCGDTDPYVNTTSPSTDGNPNPNPTDTDPYVNTTSLSADRKPNPKLTDADCYVNTPLTKPM